MTYCFSNPFFSRFAVESTSSLTFSKVIFWFNDNDNVFLYSVLSIHWFVSLPCALSLLEVADCGEMQLMLQPVSRSDEVKTAPVCHSYFARGLYLCLFCFPTEYINVINASPLFR